MNSLRFFTKNWLWPPPHFWYHSTIGGTSSMFGGCDISTAVDMSSFFMRFPDFVTSDDRSAILCRLCSHDSPRAGDSSHQNESKDEFFFKKKSLTGPDQVGWDRIGSGPMVGSDPFGSEDTISNTKSKNNKNTKDLYITEARAFLHLHLLIARTLKQCGHPRVHIFDPVREHQPIHALLDVLR